MHLAPLPSTLRAMLERLPFAFIGLSPRHRRDGPFSPEELDPGAEGRSAPADARVRWILASPERDAVHPRLRLGDRRPDPAPDWWIPVIGFRANGRSVRWRRRRAGIFRMRSSGGPWSASGRAGCRSSMSRRNWASTRRACAAGQGSSARRGRALRGAPSARRRARPRPTWRRRTMSHGRAVVARTVAHLARTDGATMGDRTRLALRSGHPMTFGLEDEHRHIWPVRGRRRSRTDGDHRLTLCRARRLGQWALMRGADGRRASAASRPAPFSAIFAARTRKAVGVAVRHASMRLCGPPADASGATVSRASCALPACVDWPQSRAGCARPTAVTIVRPSGKRSPFGGETRHWRLSLPASPFSDPRGPRTGYDGPSRRARRTRCGART